VTRWRRLGEELLVKYLDGNVKDEHGKALHPPYPDEWYRRIAREDGAHLRVLQLEGEPVHPDKKGRLVFSRRTELGPLATVVAQDFPFDSEKLVLLPGNAQCGQLPRCCLATRDEKATGKLRVVEPSPPVESAKPPCGAPGRAGQGAQKRVPASGGLNSGFIADVGNERTSSAGAQSVTVPPSIALAARLGRRPRASREGRSVRFLATGCVVAGRAVLLAGCSEVDWTEVRSQRKASAAFASNTGGQNLALRRGQGCWYLLWAIPLGPEGGGSAMELTLERVVGKLPAVANEVAASALYRFGPGHVTFARAVAITLPVTGSPLAESVRLYRVDSVTGKLERICRSL